MSRWSNIAVVTLAAVGVGILTGIVTGFGFQQLPQTAVIVAGRLSVEPQFVMTNNIQMALNSLATLSFVFAIAVGLLYGIKSGDVAASLASGYASYYGITVTAGAVMGFMMGMSGDPDLLRAWGTAASGLSQSASWHVVIEGIPAAGIAGIVTGLTQLVD